MSDAPNSLTSRMSGLPSSRICVPYLGSFLLAILLSLTAALAFAGDGSVNPVNGDVDFNAHFRFPPTTQQLVDVKASIDRMAFGMCDATDGQMRVRQVTLSQGQANEDLGDFWINALPGRSGVSFSADGSGLGRLGSHVDMLSGAIFASDVYLHEFGHHAFGLGDEYDEQRRWGGTCGIGRGFEIGTTNEQNHSIMQQSGSAQCVGGANNANACLRDTDCPAAAGGPAGTCQLVLMSELTTNANHDPIRATGGTCPAVVPLTQLRATGTLQLTASVAIFDSTSFPNALASSSAMLGIEVIDASGAAPGPTLNFYFTRIAASQWQASALVDAAVTGGTAGTPQLIEQWTLTFNPDGSLASISEPSPSLTLVGLASGAANLDISVFFGTANPTATAGAGRDGLIENGLTTALAITGNATQPLCGDNAYCARVWNATNNRYESTQQTDMNAGLSDWATLDRNYPFITPPAGLPAANAPATCFRPVTYVENVVGSDQVLLILDKSGSMSWSSVDGIGEVCSNGADDDADGTVDEAECGDPRINFIKAAANAYVDLQRDNTVDVGVMTFNDVPTLDLQIGTLNAGNIATYKTIIDGIGPGGETGIGDALDASAAEFSRVATLGRSRTAYLMTDGFNTSGVSPTDAAARLRDIGVRVHVIPAGSEVDEVELGGVASSTGGALFPAPSANELVAIYAELAGRHSGAAMVLPRTNFDLSMRGGVFNAAEGNQLSSHRLPPREYAIPIPVEKNAKSLVAFVSTRNVRISDWSLAIELRGPNGEIFGPGSPELTVASHYLFLNVKNPAAGTWNLVSVATGPAMQEATAVAFISNPFPDFFVDAKPRVLNGGGRVKVSANPSFVTRLEGDVSITARVSGPAGITAPISMSQNSSGAWEGTAGVFSANGAYRVDARVVVGPQARPAPGESIYRGPERPAVEVTSFTRYASTSFFVVKARGYPCARENRGDCDKDSIPDEKECRGFPEDIDGDGRPNDRDTDADGDGIPDAVEGMRDLNRNRVPDMCEKSQPRVAPPPITKTGEDCMPLRGRFIALEQYGRRWRLADRNLSVVDFDTSADEAKRALTLVRKYGVTHICYVGRPKPSLTYLLVDGKAPEGGMRGELCSRFDPAALSVTNLRDQWRIGSGRETLFSFGTDRKEAYSSLEIIKRYGFTHACRTGDSESALHYLRR